MAAAWIDQILSHLDRDLERVEVLENDGRHGIGSPWLVVRGWTRSVPPPKPGTVYLGKPRTPRLRRLYAHPSGYLVEGGRGGARLFQVALGSDPHPFHSPISSTGTVARTSSIRLGVEVVEALSAERGASVESMVIHFLAFNREPYSIKQVGCALAAAMIEATDSEYLAMLGAVKG